MATGLSAPQAVAINFEGRLLLAEQGRNRVIQFERRDGRAISISTIGTDTD
jgi:hypothetical protein